jgi:branched-chain amino acid transport system ATP-binding protein
VPASKLSALGLSRTFQGGRLFERMTVFENVLAASLLTGVNRAEAAKRANSLLDQFDLLHRSSTMASELPYGEERLLSIARSLASQPTFLLLDEPAAGLNENETHRLKEKLGRIPGEFGCGMLIVEHDMDLIMGICENVWVLANGKNLAHGLPEAVSSDKNVIREYLGEGLIDAA